MANITLLTSKGCTPCLRVKRILHDLQDQFSISVEEVEFTSPAGSRLAIEHNIVYPPAVFLEHKLIARGKIYPEQLIAAIRAKNGGS